MKDGDLVSEVRDSFAQVRTTKPLDTIMARARVLRWRRRRVPAVITLALAVGLGLITFMTLRGSEPSQMQLAAWTVARQPGGTILVTIRELRDPAGLQRQLSENGVSAVVYFGSGNEIAPDPRCKPYPGNDLALIQRIYPSSGTAASTSGEVGLAISPSAIPRSAKLSIGVSPPAKPVSEGAGLYGSSFAVSAGLCS